MRKDIGNKNQQARAAAVEAIEQFKGKSIKSLTTAQVKELLTIVMQLLGLADDEGNVKT
jgi:hypothetical protein